MMTDKPTPKKSSRSKETKEKANTITKSTQNTADISSQNTPQTKVSVNMSDSTKAVTDNVGNHIVSNNKDSGDKSTELKKSVKNNTTQKKSTETTKTPSRPQQDKKTMKSASSSKISKISLLSLLIALLAVAGVVVLYFWHMQQQVLLTNQLEQVKSITAENNLLAQNKMVKTFQDQKQNLTMQFTDSVNNMKSETQNSIKQLNEMVEKFSQNQPTDWLVHEAEYLVRIAARTLWLEKDTTAAIGLLQDADARIAELNDPEVLPVRQLIYQDIEALKLVPKLETEEAILSLMALGEQVQSLPLVTMSVPKETANMDRFTLSDDVVDWRENISKTWSRFLETFVVVHSRVGELEPILPIEQRENVKENLSLKLQIAQWAASKGKHDVFVKSLTDAQLWLAQYFEMNDVKNKAFSESLESLKSKIIIIGTEQKLVSLKAIRQILAGRTISKPIQLEVQNAIENSIKEVKEEVSEAVETLNVESMAKDNVNNSVEKVEQNPQRKIEPNTENDKEKSIEIENKPTEELKQKVTKISEAA